MRPSGAPWRLRSCTPQSRQRPHRRRTVERFRREANSARVHRIQPAHRSGVANYRRVSMDLIFWSLGNMAHGVKRGIGINAQGTFSTFS